MRFVIVTGLSGAGKTEAIRCFEDLGYFCVDNLPPVLIAKFAELCEQARDGMGKIALVIDVRGGTFFDALLGVLDEFRQKGFGYEILFLEAADETLIQRFKASRRRHPLAERGGTLEGIAAERKRLEPLRARADVVLDSSRLSTRQLRQELSRRFAVGSPEQLDVTVLSFGFKHGLPLDADLVFDVRFLPNPNYVAALQPLDGRDPTVSGYVFRQPLAQRFWTRLADFVDFLLPHFSEEGKQDLLIGIGCTGGRHRSVAFAERLGHHLRQRGGVVTVEHRDLERDPAAEREAE